MSECRNNGDGGCAFWLLLLWLLFQGCGMSPRLERIEQKVDAIEKVVRMPEGAK